MAWAVHDLIGLVGVACIVGAYGALQTGRIQASALGYSLLNAVGAALVLVSLIFDFNISAALMEGFWLLISLYGVERTRRLRR